MEYREGSRRLSTGKSWSIGRVVEGYRPDSHGVSGG